MLVLPVVNDGVWQSAHPTEPKSALPLAIDGAPPGVSIDGTGGASMRMKNENFSIELIAPTAVVASVSTTLLGWAANWHAGALVALGLEHLVGDPHFDVVGLAGEQQQRLVLPLPAEPRDRAVVAVVVGLPRDRAAGEMVVRPPADAERLRADAVAARFASQRRVRDHFDQPGTEHRRRNAEDHVVVGELGGEVRLLQRARPAPGRPVIVNSAWTPPSGEPSRFQMNLASRTGPFTDRNDGTVSPPPFVANATCGLTAGLVPPLKGCAWQPTQLSRFIRGPMPSVISSASSKSSFPGVEVFLLLRGETGDRTAGARRRRRAPRVAGNDGLGRDLDLEREEAYACHREDC